MTSKIIYVLILTLTILTSCGRHQPEIKKEKIGNNELAYYTRGSGEPLVMIMGFRGTMAIWDPALLEILEKKYKLILFDNQGVGLSTSSADDRLTISKMAEDTAQLIKSLGYKKVHVLGWSMGSRIGIRLALSHPEIVETLILCSPNPGGKHQAPRKTNALDKLGSQKSSTGEILSVLFPETAAGRKASLEYVTRITEGIAKGTVPDDMILSPQIIEKQLKALNLWSANEQVYGLLPKIKMPTLLAGGTDDVLDNPQNIKIIANRLPFAWTAFFPGAGHAFLFQDHKNFAELVTLFIESNKKQTNK